MSLSIQQCVNVVKLWGWGKNDFDAWQEIMNKYRNERDQFYVPGCHDMYAEEWLIAFINSWQGFGLTVEAMGNGFKSDLIYVLDAWTYNYNDAKDIIKQTHLAALSAIK